VRRQRVVIGSQQQCERDRPAHDEVFRAPQFHDVSLSDWITHTPPALVAQHLNIDDETIARLPRNKPEIVPG
jgi:hypothetical protein